MSDARAETLLKSALEKIVYFEARSEQLGGDLAAARAEVEQLKRDLTTAASRELELRQKVAELEVAVHRSHRDREELGRMNEALKSERTVLLGKLIESSRIHSAGEEVSEANFDLASFIAELRSEVLAARAPQTKVPGMAALMKASNAEAPTAMVQAVAQVVASSNSLAAAPPAAPASPPPLLAAAPLASGAQGASLSAAAPPRSNGGASPFTGAEAVAVSASPTSGNLYSPDVAQVAERLLREGRLRVTEEELTSLTPRLAGRTEETLFGFSVRELSAPDSAARIRAAERLTALGEKAAAPALAAALHGETDPAVLVVLLATFAGLAHKEGVPVVLPLLESESPDVRIAALKALVALDPADAGPRIAAASKDRDPSVRRRASLLALGFENDSAVRLEDRVTDDEDPEVRRLCALALGASSGDKARGQLLEALKDEDLKVRRAAAQSLSRLLGEDLTYVVTLDPAIRRREIRRLATLPIRRVTAATRAEAPARPAPVVPPVAAPPRPLPAASTAQSFGVPAPAPLPAPTVAPAYAAPAARAAAPRPPRPEQPAPAGDPKPEVLCHHLLVEMRTAIRGRSLQDLSSAARVSVERAEDACALLVARGQAVKRGLKYFVA